MSRAYGIGLIGAGGIFEAHYSALRGLAPRVMPVAVAERNPERLCAIGRRYFVPYATDDHRRLLARSDVDIVDVLTPPGTHARIVQDALEAGKVVVCEKPLATSLAQIDRLEEVCRAHPGRLSTMYQRRYFPEMLTLATLRESGRLGRLVGGHFARYSRGDAARTSPSWGHFAESGGGVVIASFVHELDLIAEIFGLPTRVSATTDTLHMPIEAEDTFAATLQFPGGARVSCSAAVGVGDSLVEFEVVGTREVFRFSSASRPSVGPRGPGRAGAIASRIARRFRRGPAFDPGATHRRFFEKVLDALDGGEPLPVGLDEARRATEIAVSLYASALSERPVELPIDPTSPAYRGLEASDYSPRAARGSRRQAGEASR